ncbi:MAG: SLBB domain-containing protein [Bacteroidaceae bacterium]|nr:SLBB domain-containing protein [Bacteroidaceae bacterium]
MIKKLLFILTLAFLPELVFAQSMTDDQVVKFVKQQQEAGQGQQQIVSKLLQKGVTTEQLRRIKKKYDAEHNNLGASDLTGKKTNASRSRQKFQKDGEESQMRNNYMKQSQYRSQRGKYANSKERKEAENELSDEIGFMDIDSLIYYKNYFNDDQKAIFGHNIFNNENLSFQPDMNIATPANYRLGAGDNVIIDIWGAAQQTIDGEISPDGTITVEGVGPLKIGGMTVSEANTYLKSAVGRFYEGSNIVLTVGNTRSIQVQVVGEVNVPGTYTLSSLSTAFNALYTAGGISEIGTLRNIKVYRGGRQVSKIDVYDYLIKGSSKGDIHLEDNDVIVVGTYDALVEVRGKIKRPMFYEVKTSESVKTLLEYAGGFRGDSYRKSIRLVRKTGAEYSIHTLGEFEWSDFKLHDGDSIYIDSIIPRYSNMAEIRGAVFHAGMFQIDGNISTVRQLVKAAEGLREDAFTSRAVMHREKDDKSLEVLSVDINGIMNGSVADIPLRKNDVLFIPSKLDMLGDRTFKINGEVNYPGTYVYADNTSIEDLVIQAGGLTDAASTVKVDVYRRSHNPNALQDDNGKVETFSFALKDGFVVDGKPGFVLQPYDEVVVRRNPTYVEQRNVKISGSINFEGEYSMTSNSYKLSDLVNAAGGPSSLAYLKGARLERTMTDEEKKQVEATLRTSQIALYEEAMQSDNKNFDIARADTLLQMKLDIGNVYPVAIDLEAAMAEPGGDDDIVLRDGDHIIIPQFSNTVKVSGDVMYPNTLNYIKGKSIKYYINRAGGYGDNARKSRVYAIYMNGSVKLINSSKDIQPGCQIVVPSKKNKHKMTTAEYSAMGTSAASIATMLITIANLLK